ncbi:hypothetical protein GXY_13743 [Novacetimonas hansenii ATCC 23769]|uniref:Uncharacterized protein n=1 Tax=Novacetimonas hansenii ATCC 23769 TaxID=714995 RepID=D5QHX0_NOVHA|nr:hypothetical protein GXY_13743 [Novacetimonas hansenii ATCC 23769]
MGSTDIGPWPAPLENCPAGPADNSSGDPVTVVDGMKTSH